MIFPEKTSCYFDWSPLPTSEYVGCQTTYWIGNRTLIDLTPITLRQYAIINSPTSWDWTVSYNNFAPLTTCIEDTLESHIWNVGFDTIQFDISKWYFLCSWVALCVLFPRTINIRYLQSVAKVVGCKLCPRPTFADLSWCLPFQHILLYSILFFRIRH